MLAARQPWHRAKASTMPAKRQSQRGAAKRPRVPVLRFRMRVTDGDKIAVGPGKIALLEAVATAGSITAAAKSLDMSYRRAWLLLDELNRSLEHPAVDSAKGGLQGGGTSLTEAGQQLITLYRRIEKRAEASCRDDIALLMSMLAR
jgi:molybdate transport system regulatory protein